MWNPFGRHDGPSFIERHGDAIIGALGGALAERLLFRDRDNHRRNAPPPVVLEPQPRVEPLGPFEVPVISNNRTPFAQLHAEYRRGVDEDLAELDARTRTRQGRIQTIANVWNPNQSNTPWQNNTRGGKFFNDVVSGPLGAEQIGGWGRAASPSNSPANIYANSRANLADFQAHQAAKKQAQKEYMEYEQKLAQQRQEAQRRQQLEQAEQRAIEARLREATHTPERSPVPNTLKGWAIHQESTERERLSKMQRVLNQYFGETVFDRVDMEYPYAVENGKRIADPNIFRVAAILDWILFQDRSDGQWSDQELELLEANQDVENWLPDEKKRQLKLAAKMHKILVKNEELGKQRDDAKAFADGVRAVIEASKDGSGTVNPEQVIDYIKLFMIDQSPNGIGLYSRFVYGIGSSNAAYNSMAARLLGTKGWNEKYWDYGKQYDENGQPINQVTAPRKVIQS